MMLSPFGFGTQTEPVQTHTLNQQRALASSALRKVRAFLLGAYRFEARYADYPSDHVSIESGGVILDPAQLEAGVRYNVFWDYQGETGSDIAWKFRGDSGLPDSVCIMENSMETNPNIRMPGSLLHMASSDWVQTFYDMMVNYEIYGSVVRPEEPRSNHAATQERNSGDQPDEEDEDEEDSPPPDYAALVATKWNAIFERVKANEYDVECMFVHSRQGCLAPAGTCPFKHTPLADHRPSDGLGSAGMMAAMGPYAYFTGEFGWDSD